MYFKWANQLRKETHRTHERLIYGKNLTYGLGIRESSLNVPVLLYDSFLFANHPHAKSLRDYYKTEYPDMIWIPVQKIPARADFQPLNHKGLAQWKESEIKAFQAQNIPIELQDAFVTLAQELWGV